MPSLKDMLSRRSDEERAAAIQDAEAKAAYKRELEKAKQDRINGCRLVSERLNFRGLLDEANRELFGGKGKIVNEVREVKDDNRGSDDYDIDYSYHVVETETLKFVVGNNRRKVTISVTSPPFKRDRRNHAGVCPREDGERYSLFGELNVVLDRGVVIVREGYGDKGKKLSEHEIRGRLRESVADRLYEMGIR